MWSDLIEEYGAGLSCPPADPAVLRRVEQTLGHSLPPDLGALLLQTDGIEGPYGEGVVWPAEQILQNNRTFRADPEIRASYRPFDSLLFIGDNGGGDQFALLWACGARERAGVHVWDHETDERRRVARTWPAMCAGRWGAGERTGTGSSGSASEPRGRSHLCSAPADPEC
ncbi:SMI1/KNR4 family protein [Streptomyces sp. SID7499]|uniref:SMI1/KNR4 family protein n=1 Tax=Streptomyces sp. SID7499 TaxID=2706086 RepID=A0A6G3X456_9ACTN|nr:SMI1/KNR4 family protein [Streptomyces sp. SID7499]